MKCIAVAAALVALAGAPRGAAAQGTLAGKWTTEFDIGIRSENGVETSMGKRQATMTLTVRGDSVLGTWQVVPDSGGVAPPSIRLTGTRVGNKATIQAEPVERTVRINDDEQRVKLVSVYSFELKGDELVGTTRVTSPDGSIDRPERPFSAKRVM